MNSTFQTMYVTVKALFHYTHNTTYLTKIDTEFLRPQKRDTLRDNLRNDLIVTLLSISLFLIRNVNTASCSFQTSPSSSYGDRRGGYSESLTDLFFTHIVRHGVLRNRLQRKFSSFTETHPPCRRFCRKTFSVLSRI